MPRPRTFAASRGLLVSLIVPVYGGINVRFTATLCMTVLLLLSGMPAHAQDPSPSSDSVAAPQDAANAVAVTNCSLPSGQVFPSTSGDPLVPVYCLPDAPVHAPTRVTNANDWVDTFEIGDGNTARFNDGDFGYRVFDNLGGIADSKHMVIGDHWIDDNQQQYGGGAMIRPDRTFRFEGNPPRLVVEADVSAGKQVYSGDQWTELVVTTASQPDRPGSSNVPAEQEYAYGRFATSNTFGCRLQNGGTQVCAGFVPTLQGVLAPTADRAPCYSLSPDRLWELSFFQDCGNNYGGVHFGGLPGSGPPVFRSCAPSDDYDPCLDRFRVELTQHGMLWYVNGQRYFEDSGWDSAHSFPPAFMTGNLYVYLADWTLQGPAGQPVRYHWERFAINPHDAQGNIVGPSASPSFGPQTPPTPTPIATVRPASTGTPVPLATPTPTLVPIATVVATVVVPTVVATVIIPITCEVSVRVNGITRPYTPC